MDVTSYFQTHRSAQGQLQFSGNIAQHAREGSSNYLVIQRIALRHLCSAPCPQTDR